MGLLDFLGDLLRTTKTVSSSIKNVKETVSAFTGNKTVEVVIEKEPQTPEEFVQMRNQKATTPEGGAAMFLLALKKYVENQKLGSQFLVLSIVKKHLTKGDIYKGYGLGSTDKYLLNQLSKYPYVPNSYILGATPENNYKVQLPYRYKFEYQKYSGNPKTDDEVKIFVFTSGAERTRPITLYKNEKGIWKVAEFSSIVVSVIPPASAKEEDEL